MSRKLTVEELGKAMSGAVIKTMNNPSRTRCFMEVTDAETGEVLSDPVEHLKLYKTFEGHLSDEIDAILDDDDPMQIPVVDPT